MPYPCIVADPPWRFGDQLPGPGRGAAKHYRTLTVEQIIQLEPYREMAMAAPDAVLFLWRVSAMQQEAFDVARGWGFRVHSEMVWAKLSRKNKPSARCETCGHVDHKRHFGMGRIVRGAHETCLIAVRGKPRILTRSIRSVFEAPVGAHSEKPDAFYDLVEDLVPGPRVEFFARRQRLGWACFGDQAGALDAPGIRLAIGPDRSDDGGYCL